MAAVTVTIHILTQVRQIEVGLSLLSFRFSEEIPNEENEINNDNLSKSSAEAKAEGSPPALHKKVLANNTMERTGNHDTAITVSCACGCTYIRTRRIRGRTTG